MITICPNCGTQIGKGVVKCPKCAELFFENTFAEGPNAVSKNASFASSAPFATAIPPQTESFASVGKENQKERSLSIDEAVQIVYSGFRSKIFFWNLLMIWSLVFSGVAIFLVVRTTMMINEMIDKNIAEKFLDKNLTSTLTEVAQKETKQILSKHLEPVIKEADKKIQESADSIESSKQRFEEKYADLAKESALLEEKKMILKLSEQSLRGYRKAYEELVLHAQRKEPKELAQIALEEKTRIENAFRLSSRIEGATINYTSPLGKGLVNELVPTDILIREMKTSPHWKMRARAAQLLGARVETGVPEILLEAADQDASLDVMKYALESFSKITGYETVEIFDVQAATAWWQENQPSGKHTPEMKEKTNG